MIAPSERDFELSNSSSRSTSLTSPSPSQRGHMPPVTVSAPGADGMLNENACGDPMCGWPSLLKSRRSIAYASVTVPTVDRALAPIRSWSTMIAGLMFSSPSTSGRLS
ncbi:hypothetical protein QE428_001210 [Microbacterium sp. SORGH_AS 505]|nr:hypothetical protein [Microbacterium sp. SORGH_AS_0505]